MDNTIFGDGVLVDINAHRITIALKPGERIPVRAVYTRIKKGGYDPVTMHLRVKGRVAKVGETIRITSADSGQYFVLLGTKVADLVNMENVDLQVRLDAKKISTLGDDEMISVELNTILHKEE
ncbi:MAG: hypothetical protein VCD00_13650 [Candidatus Hydrogenedentota bacterium]